VNALRALARGLRRVDWIDRSSRWLMDVLGQWPFIYPTGLVTHAADWVHARQRSISWFGGRMGPWYKERYPAETHVFPRCAVELREHLEEFSSKRVWYTPACGLFYLDGAYVLAPNGAILSPAGELFDEFSHCWNDFRRRGNVYYKPFATFSPRPRRIRDVVATVTSIGCDNYYHWMFNLMPRIHLLREVMDGIDHFLVPDLLHPFQLEALAAAGLPEEKTIPLGDRAKYFCERIFVPSIGPHDGAVPRWSIDYLRDTFLPPGAGESPPTRKIYLSRGSQLNRSIANESELIRVMVAHGFEVIIPHELTIHEQAAIFAQATHIIGAHGAAFANMVFSTQAIVAEIFSPAYLNVGCYSTLAYTCGHRYAYFVGDLALPAAGSKSAINVDLGDFVQWLARTLT
jgi:hypothetical protein